MKVTKPIFILLAILSVIIYGCNKHANISSNGNNNNSNYNSSEQSLRAFKSIQTGDTFEMASNVIFIKNDINSKLQQVNSDNLVFTATGFQDTIKEGDILYFNSNTNGYARKIISKSTSNGMVTFTTKQAAITDVYNQLNETYNYNPVFQQDKLIFYDVDSFLNKRMDTLPPTYRTNSTDIPGIATSLTDIRPSINGLNLSTIISAINPRIKITAINSTSISFDYILYDVDNNYSTTNDQLIISLTVGFSDNNYISPSIKNGGLNVNGAYYFDTKISLSKKYSTNFTAIDKYLRTNLLDRRFPLVSIPFVPAAAFNPGSLLIEPKVDIFAILSLDLDGQVAVSAYANHTGVIFQSYFNPLTFEKQSDAHFDKSSMTSGYNINAEVSGTAKAGIGAGLTAGFLNFPISNFSSAYIGVYGSVSLSGNIVAKLTSSSTSNKCYDLDLNTNVVGDIWAEGKLSIIKDYDVTWDILKNYNIATLAEKKYSYCTGDSSTPTVLQTPVLTTSNVTGTTSTSVLTGGNITSNGGFGVTSRGVCWNTLPNPSISNFKTVDSSGNGSFISKITGLNPSTTYFVRAYATNSVGTAYGNEISFITNQSDNSSSWTQVSTGYYHTAAIKSDGTLWAWGLNTSGQLGDGTFIDKNLPTKVGVDNKWKQVSCGDSYTLAVKLDGTLWAWGANLYGRFGDGSISQEVKSSPTQIGNGTNWTQVAAGNTQSVGIKSDGSLSNFNSTGDVLISDYSGTLNWSQAATCYSISAIKADGTLWGSGGNVWGEIGDGSTTSRIKPVQIGSDNMWTKVVCGNYYTLGLKRDGTIWAWGMYDNGSLGLGNLTSFGKPISVPTQIGTENDWSDISCNYMYSTAVKTDGTIWAWGKYNGSNGAQVGFSPIKVATVTNPLQIACGNGNSTGSILVLKKDGTLWSVGDNYYGQLGDGTNVNKTTPVQIK